MSLFQGQPGDPEWLEKSEATDVSVVNIRSGSGVTTYQLLPGHNLSLGHKAEAEDLGLSADPRSLVAPPKGGPADIFPGCSQIF